MVLHHDFEIAIRVVFRFQNVQKTALMCSVQSNPIKKLLLLSSQTKISAFEKFIVFLLFQDFRSSHAYLIAFSACLIEVICIWPGQGLFHGVSAG